MARPRSVPRTPEQRALYAELMRELDDLRRDHADRLHARLIREYIAWGAGRVRAQLKAQFSDPGTSFEDRATIAEILLTHPEPEHTND